MTVAHRRRALFAVVGAAATANILVGLGSSSYFVDEVLSVRHAVLSLHGVIHVVRTSESTPWTYFVFLHEWIYHLGSQAEWVARLPSALAALALVAAIGWVAFLVGGWSLATAASGAAAVSPFVLEYGQQARVYVFAMLAVTVAVGSVVKASRPSRRSGAWLGVAAAAACASLLAHYTAAMVVLPLCLWTSACRSLPVAWRAAFVAACVLTQAALVPLAIDQYHAAPDGGLVGIANVTWANVARVAGTPFDARTVVQVDVIAWLGAATTVIALAWLLLRAPDEVSERLLLLALAIAAPVGLLLAGLAGKDVVITRYSAVSAPFLIIAVACVIAFAPRSLGGAIAVVAAGVSIVGVVRSHQNTGFYADARAVVATIKNQQRPGDVVIQPGHPALDVPLAYYGERFRPVPAYASTNSAAVAAAFRSRERLWVVSEVSGETSRSSLLRYYRAIGASLGYRLQSLQIRPGVVTMALALLVPT